LRGTVQTLIEAVTKSNYLVKCLKIFRGGRFHLWRWTFSFTEAVKNVCLCKLPALPLSVTARTPSTAALTKILRHPSSSPPAQLQPRPADALPPPQPRQQYSHASLSHRRARVAPVIHLTITLVLHLAVAPWCPRGLVCLRQAKCLGPHDVRWRLEWAFFPDSNARGDCRAGCGSVLFGSDTRRCRASGVGAQTIMQGHRGHG
jgi:hypothetical protein